MRKAKIYYKGEEAGELTQHDDGSFSFSYGDLWLADQDKPSLSLTLPKSVKEHHSYHLFPSFFNMLPEGSNKNAVCTMRHLDENDYFSLLISTAGYDTIGAVTVVKTQESL